MSTLKKSMKKGACAVLAAVMLTAGVAFPSYTNQKTDSEPFAFVQTIEASAASKQVITGCFNNNNWSGYTYAYATSYRNWRGQTIYRNPKLKFCAFNSNGKIRSGKFTVEITTPQSRNFRVTKTIKGSGYWTLNYGYSSYKIRIKRDNSWVNYANNVAATRYWSIDATSNSYFW